MVLPGTGTRTTSVSHQKQHERQHHHVVRVFDDAGEGYVTDSNIRQAVKFAGGMLNYPDRGIPIDRLDTHSLRTGGACALKLAGYDDVTIRKMGRWKPSSNVFLEYIQHQLSSFSHGMSKKMATIPVFTNMEGAVTRVTR